MNKQDLEPLTEEQKKAVSHRKGPACVIAGAGTGKTTALSARIVHLVKEQNIDPGRILVTTFTRKATAELYGQAYWYLGDAAHQLRISTIDAAIWDLAQQAMQCGLMRPARLIGEAEQRLLLLQSAWETFGQGQVSAYSKISWTESVDKAGLVGLLETCVRADLAEGREKQNVMKRICLKLEELQNRFYLGFDFKIPTVRDLKRTVKRYLKELKGIVAIDYDLLSRDFLRCLRRHKKLAREFASQFDEILVDEFQDTSRIQAEILLLLSGKQRNIWVVGDPCQQIYEWRGAGPENLIRFIKKTKAKKYHLTENWRSTQVILDSAYHFLGRRVAALQKNGMLKPLKSKRDEITNRDGNLPVLTGTLNRAFYFVKQLLVLDPDLRPGDIAILSRKLHNKSIVKEIRKKADATNGLKVQFHSSRADHAMEQTIGDPPDWKPGTALKNLYKHPQIQKLIAHSLHKRDFSDLRTIRPIATAAEALDSTLPSTAFTLKEAWPALKKTQDREVGVTPAVINQPNAIQVMTIHAAKGLEFPVVLLMKLGKGGVRSFPNPKEPEDSRLAYVGATRAQDLLILVHTIDKPHETLADFGSNLVAIHRNRKEIIRSRIEAPNVIPTPPTIAATHLDLYGQCPLKFAAYHEGRFLPKWTVPQSMGARMHKALEYYLRAGMPTDRIDQFFQRGFQDGDSPLRQLPRKSIDKMKQAFQGIVKSLSVTSTKVLSVEQQYRYVYGNSGQIEGAIDAVIERRDGALVLKEWKTSSEVAPEKRRPYELQARAGALGMAAQNSFPIDVIEIVPVFAPENTVSFGYGSAFGDKSKEMLEQVFKDLRDRNYEPRRGNHCKQCQLKPACPAWPKN